MKKVLLLISFLHTVLISVESYSTMPAVWQPSTDIKCFSLTWVNVLGGTAFSDGSQTTAVVPYPAGVNFTTAPRLTLAFTRY